MSHRSKKEIMADTRSTVSACVGLVGSAIVKWRETKGRKKDAEAIREIMASMTIVSATVSMLAERFSDHGIPAHLGCAFFSGIYNASVVKDNAEAILDDVMHGHSGHVVATSIKMVAEQLEYVEQRLKDAEDLLAAAIAHEKETEDGQDR